MLTKRIILIGLVIGTLFLIIATFFYPGGSSISSTYPGYDWKNNYFSDLLTLKAINQMDNIARPWAVVGVLFITSSFGIFFVDFSKKIGVKSAAFVIKYFGLTATVMSFLTVFPSLHDLMVSLSSMITLLIFFYITVFIVKSKLTMLKVVSIFFLISFYFAAFMYFTRTYLEYLPIVQKFLLLFEIAWVIALEYLTKKEDFAHIKS